MPKLNDTQLILLSTASRQPDGSFYPLPETLGGGGDRVTQAIAALVKRGLAAEGETLDAAQVQRVDHDIRYGMFVTDAGMEALDAGDHDAGPVTTPPTPAPASTSKTSAVLALLERSDGATMTELIGATGWLPHTTRAALTGLRKKGHAIERGKRDSDTCYRISAAA
ncbi:DUF3489 domain-containing protein [Sphingomonas bacterium]|uniref:DUF3489 domain-containing protein n=1 Tax=Sphingomonas bacterium TaxID=1895847 RepID=UPI0026070262|nr:DUF3489 domain-containing protein [Sphingomonas bacterium]MDB5678295.1 hypothetical protein [Sphingomonas bacterium]